MLSFFYWSQWHKTRKQHQKENWKIHKRGNYKNILLNNQCIICRKILENGLWMAVFWYSRKITISSCFPFYDSCLYLASESYIKTTSWVYIVSWQALFNEPDLTFVWTHISVYGFISEHHQNKDHFGQEKIKSASDENLWTRTGISNGSVAYFICCSISPLCRVLWSVWFIHRRDCHHWRIVL